MSPGKKSRADKQSGPHRIRPSAFQRRSITAGNVETRHHGSIVLAFRVHWMQKVIWENVSMSDMC